MLSCRERLSRHPASPTGVVLTPSGNGKTSSVETGFGPFDARDPRYPYTCTFHWFRLPDQSIVGLDVIRSDESTDSRQYRQMGLRVFLLAPGKPMRWLVEVHDRSAWDAYFDGERPPSNIVGRQAEAGQPVIGRGKGWVAAAVSSGSQGENRIARVSFQLDIAPQSPMQTNGNVLGQLTGLLSSRGLHLSAADFTRVVTRGSISIDGTAPIQVESVGPASIHYGQFLPEYAYIATVPVLTDSGSAPVEFLLGSVHKDNFAIPVPKDLPFTYAYTRWQNVPERLFALGKAPEKGSRRIALGKGWSILLSEIQSPVEHKLLDVPTWTAAASGRLDRGDGDDSNLKGDEALDVGTVILDFRGDYYIDILR